MTITELKKRIVRSQSGNINSPSDDDLFSIVYSLCNFLEELQKRVNVLEMVKPCDPAQESSLEAKDRTEPFIPQELRPAWEYRADWKAKTHE